jgi:hypothetical protein
MVPNISVSPSVDLQIRAGEEDGAEAGDPAEVSERRDQKRRDRLADEKDCPSDSLVAGLFVERRRPARDLGNKHLRVPVGLGDVFDGDGNRVGPAIRRLHDGLSDSVGDPLLLSFRPSGGEFDDNMGHFGSPQAPYC